jgi:signal transduction histidine kinase
VRVDVDKAAHNLRQLEGMAVQSLDELRRLISDLRPSHLDDLGLPAALRWYASEIESRTDLKIHVDAPTGPCVLPIQIKTALFRVAQEALTNVIKHAEAENVWIKVQRSDWDVWLEVWDDGSGFDSAQLSSSGTSSWGLLGMQERVALCGGRLNLETAPGEGTKISVAIPCHPTLDLEEDDEDETDFSR